MMIALVNKIINLIKSCLKLKTKLSTYTAGTVRANQKLKELAEYLKTVDRPTILVAFGDHLPNLQEVYDSYGF